jgi:hypothetical protein
MQRIAIRKYETRVERAAPTIPTEGMMRTLSNKFKTAAEILM